MEDFLRIGVITSTHGLKGEVKVYPTTDSPKRFLEVENVILKTPKGDIQTRIEGARFFKNLVIVKFETFNDVDQVNAMQGTDVMIERKDAQPLEEGEYYIADLLGCKVRVEEESRKYCANLLKDGEWLGTVKDVLQTGANDVYVVKTFVKDPDEVLLPVIPACIKNVDIEGGVITAFVLPGLID